MAQLQKGTTYITGDQVTAANLNALVDSGILTPGAVTDQTAKTVPLAADTILLHSAADTALRKTTMTQLFATPQPLGATTPSSVAATTGTFSSTLGVTGVATLGNGAILGTPASGTVTNLTGTASININGTVGATTPSTVAATTISGTTGTFTGHIATSQNLNDSASLSCTNASSGTAARARVLLIADAGNAQVFATSTGYTDITGAADSMVFAANSLSGGYQFSIDGAVAVAKITSTGLNSTAIGATTPSTGAFTSVSASGNVNAGSTAGWEYGALGRGSFSGANSSITGAGILQVLSTDSQAADLGGSISLGGYYIAQSNAINFAMIAGRKTNSTSSNTEGYLSFGVRPNGGNITEYARLTSTGLAVTGTLSATSTISTSGTETNVDAVRMGSTGRYGIGFNTNAGGYFNIWAHQSATRIGIGFDTGSYGTFSEKLTVLAGGNVGIGTTVPANVFHTVSASGQYSARIGVNGTGSQSFINFVIGENTTPVGVGTVTYNGSLVLYNQTSDYRIKNITGSLTESGTFIDALKPRVGTWKSNGSKFVGFVAHEFAEVCPSAVTGEKDAVDADGNAVYQAMQAGTAEVIANLVAELQSLRKRLAALESK